MFSHRVLITTMITGLSKIWYITDSQFGIVINTNTIPKVSYAQERSEVERRVPICQCCLLAKTDPEGPEAPEGGRPSHTTKLIFDFLNFLTSKSHNNSDSTTSAILHRHCLVTYPVPYFRNQPNKLDYLIL